MIGVYEWYAIGCALFMLVAAAVLMLWHDPRGANWLSDILSRRSRALIASRWAYKQAWKGVENDTYTFHVLSDPDCLCADISCSIEHKLEKSK